MLYLFAILWLLVFTFTLANGWYHNSSRKLWQRTARVPDGREGKIVSHFPFDLRVTVNVESSDLNYDGTHKREWVTCWRWEARRLER